MAAEGLPLADQAGLGQTGGSQGETKSGTLRRKRQVQGWRDLRHRVLDRYELSDAAHQRFFARLLLMIEQRAK